MHGVLVFLMVVLVIGAAGAAPPPGYTLTWSDEFNQGAGSRPDPAVWVHELGAGGWGNNELQTYVNDAEHSRIVADPEAEGGQALEIRATKDSQGRYHSARLKTSGKKTFQHGYLEARIKLPYGQGIWPAFWMLGQNISSVGWPTAGEIDIMEYLGHQQSTSYGTLHGPGYSGGAGLGASYTLPGGKKFPDAYHTFAVRWRPDAITFYVDGVAFRTRSTADLPAGSKWVFDQPFFFLINLAVGGNWPGYPDASTVFPQSLRVDYVRVYQTKPPTERTVSLKSLANSQYVTAPEGSGLIASQPLETAAARFEVVDAGSGKVALKDVSSGNYVTVTNNGAGPLVAQGASIGTWETFTWVDAGIDTVALKAAGNGRYVCAENAGAGALVANRVSAGTWESFRLAVEREQKSAMADAVTALRGNAGLEALSPQGQARLNVEAGAPVDVLDAARFTRWASGLDTL